MINKENCEIVKDLLPNYIDELTSKETKTFIENHLNECSNCNTILNNMKKNLEENEKNINKESIKYARKYNRKLKILIFSLISIILILFCSTFIRNAILITSLSNKSEKFIDSNNYHIYWSSYAMNYAVIHDVYYKDGKFIEYMYSYNYDFLDGGLKGGSDGQRIMYYDGTSDNYIQFFENENKEKIMKYYKTDENDIFSKPIITPYGMGQVRLLKYDLKTFIKECFLSRITLEKCNNVDAYRITKLTNEVNVLYVDKETGLTLRSQSGVYTSRPNSYTDYFSDIECEFGTVTEKDITPPNFEEYTLEENTNNN